MGNCLVSVHVTGGHHNGRQDDIDQLAADFVEALQDAGHNVTAAAIVNGGEQSLLNIAARYPVTRDSPDPKGR